MSKKSKSPYHLHRFYKLKGYPFENYPVRFIDTPKIRKFIEVDVNDFHQVFGWDNGHIYPILIYPPFYGVTGQGPIGPIVFQPGFHF